MKRKWWQFTTFVTQTNANQPNSNWFNTLIRDSKTISLADTRLYNNSVMQVTTATNICTNLERKSSWKKGLKSGDILANGNVHVHGPGITLKTRNRHTSIRRLTLSPKWKREHTKTEAATKQITKTLDMEIESEQTKKLSQIYVARVTKFAYVFPSFVQILDGLLDVCVILFSCRLHLSFEINFRCVTFSRNELFLSSVCIPFLPPLRFSLQSGMHENGCFKEERFFSAVSFCLTSNWRLLLNIWIKQKGM